MRIAVHLTVELDSPQTWAEAMGVTPARGETDAQAVRRDVLSYVLTLVQHSTLGTDYDATVELAEHRRAAKTGQQQPRECAWCGESMPNGGSGRPADRTNPGRSLIWLCRWCCDEYDG